MNKSLVIVGTGAVAAEITAHLEDVRYGSSYNVAIKGYIDISDGNMQKYGYAKPYLGRIENYSFDKNDYFIIAVGNNIYRKENAEKIIKKGGVFINLIHPTCIIANNVKIGLGNIVNPFSMIGPNAQLGDFNLLTSQSFISHDCHVGNYNFFSTAGICGSVEIGHQNTFNIRSTVIPHIKIGHRNVIQAGMIVDKDVADDSIIFHRFKEKVIAIPKN